MQKRQTFVGFAQVPSRPMKLSLTWPTGPTWKIIKTHFTPIPGEPRRTPDPKPQKRGLNSQTNSPPIPQTRPSPKIPIPRPRDQKNIPATPTPPPRPHPTPETAPTKNFPTPHQTITPTPQTPPPTPHQTTYRPGSRPPTKKSNRLTPQPSESPSQNSNSKTDSTMANGPQQNVRARVPCGTEMALFIRAIGSTIKKTAKGNSY
jgi:hypothetical protein